MMNFEALPPALQDGVKLYIDHGIEPGSFLRSVLENDLREACARADHINRHRLFEIVQCLWNEIPAECWGSPEKVNRWIGFGRKAK